MKPFLRYLRWLLALLGLLLFVVGVFTFWLPIPIGLPLMLIGMTLMVRYSPVARGFFLVMARRNRFMRWIMLRMRQRRVLSQARGD